MTINNQGVVHSVSMKRCPQHSFKVKMAEMAGWLPKSVLCFRPYHGLITTLELEPQICLNYENVSTPQPTVILWLMAAIYFNEKKKNKTPQWILKDLLPIQDPPTEFGEIIICRRMWTRAEIKSAWDLNLPLVMRNRRFSNSSSHSIYK